MAVYIAPTASFSGNIITDYISLQSRYQPIVQASFDVSISQKLSWGQVVQSPARSFFTRIINQLIRTLSESDIRGASNYSSFASIFRYFPLDRTVIHDDNEALLLRSKFISNEQNETSLPKKISFKLRIRIADDCEMTTLNKKYNGKDYPSNVLSFPYKLPTYQNRSLVTVDGDIAIGLYRVVHEANLRNFTIDECFTHLLFHSILHLMGYNHIREEDATIMEQIEEAIFYKLGYPRIYT